MSVAELDQLEAAFNEARDAVLLAPDDPEVKARYKEAKNAFASARQASRQGRPAGVVADERN